MQQQTFAAIQKAEAEDIVTEELEGGNDEDVPMEREPGAAGAMLLKQETCAKTAVPIHVLEIAFERGIGVVDEIEVKGFGGAIEADGLVDGTLFKGGGEGDGVATEQSQLGIGIVAAVAHPAAEEEIAAAQMKGIEGRVGGKQGPKLGLQVRRELFVGVEGENPGAAALGNGEVLLTGEAAPGLREDAGLEVAGDLKCAIGRAGVDDDDVVREANAGKGAREIGFFVEGDDGDREKGWRSGRGIRRGLARIQASDMGQIAQGVSGG